MFNTFTNPSAQGFANTISGIGSAAGGWIYDNWMGGNDKVARSNAAYDRVANQSRNQTSSSGGSANRDSGWAKELAAMRSERNQLAAQLAAQPVLPDFDILGGYNRAKKQATRAVTPLYNKKLNLFLEGQGIKKQEKKQTYGLERENNRMGLANQLEDNQTTRTRTGEDLLNVLQDIVGNRENFLQDEGTEFDDARRGLQEDIAAGGATDTGLGQQAIGRQMTDRNISSERQMEEFENQEAAKRLLATRSISDLATSDTRSKQQKGQLDKAAKIDFDSYMKSLANEEKSFRLTNQLERSLEIARQSQSLYNQDVAKFIAGLGGQGYRAQDIALAKQVYG